MNLDTKDKNELEELLEKKRLDKKKKRVEKLLRGYKTNKARLKILELGMVNYQDRTLNGIDYDKVTVQTSNKTDISDIVSAREEEMITLTHDIGVADALIDSLNEKDRFLTWNLYIEKRTHIQIANDMNYYDTKSVTNNRNRIVSELMELI